MANTTIRLDIEVDASKGTAAIKQFAGDAEQATKKAGDAAKEGGKGFGQFASSLDDTAAKLKDLLTPTNLLGAGIGIGLVESLKHAQEATIAYADEMTRLRGVTGAAIEDLGGLREAADKMGVGSSQLQRALLLMSSQIEAGGEALGRMGISVEDVNGKQKAELALLFEVIDKLSTMSNRTEAAALAKKTFGRAVGDLLPLLLAGTDAIKASGEAGAAFAKELGDEGVASIRQFKGQIAESEDAVNRLQITILRDAQPALSFLVTSFTAIVEAARSIPPDIRHVIEVVTVVVAGVLSLALIIKTAAAAWTLLMNIPAVAWLVNAAVAVGSMVVASGALVPVLAAIGAGLATAFVLDVDGIRSTFTSFLDGLLGKFKQFWSSLGSIKPPKDVLVLQLKEAIDDLGVLTLPPIVDARFPLPSQEDIDRNLALKRKRLEIDKEILAETLKFYQATQAPEQAQINTIKENLALKLRELELKKEERKDLAGLFDKEANEARKAAAAQEVAIEIASLKTIDAARADSLKAEITASETGEAKIRDLAKAETDAITQQLMDQAKSRSLSDAEIIQAHEKNKQITIKANDELRKLAIEQATQISAIAQKEADTVLKARENEIEHSIAGLELEQVARQHAFDTFKIPITQFTAESIANTEAVKQAKLANLKAQEDAAKDNAVRELALADLKVAGIIGGEVELATKTKDIEADLQKKLEGFSGERVKVEDENTKHVLELKLQEAKQAGILFAQEAGYIDDLKRKREQSLQNIGTFLEQQARQAGDLGAAFQVGFAQAASSADDAFAVMKKSGADAYQSLKSGLSDVLFDFLTGARNIGDVFVNLGKRILRSFTDAFAEILAKQALMAAGFSLPALLGSAGTVIAATAGFEGAPNQTATAVQQLGDSATTASQALGGVGQVSAFLSATFGSLGSLMLNFGTVLLGVMQLMGSLVTGGALGGSVGGTATNLLSTITSLGSTFGNFATLIQGGLTNSIQNLFTAFGAGEGGFFGTAAGSLGPGFLPGIGAELLGKAIPIAGGLISIGLDFLKGNIAGGVGGALGGGIGAFFGGPVGFAIGTQIGSIIGNLFGGLFSGPTPEISGKVQLNSTNIQALLAATRAVPFSSGPGPNEVNNPPGRSNFSFLDTGPLHSELFKHRTEGTLSREESQLDIQNVILATLQAAIKGLSQLGSQLPTETLSKALSTRIDAVLAKGLDVTNFDFEGDVEDVVKNFQDFLKGLSSQTVTALTKEIFPSVDLAALGAGDAAKGLDNLVAAMSAMGVVVKAVGATMNISSVSLDDFASKSVAYFQQFAKQGEAFVDTVKRITTALSGILDLQSQVAARQQALSGDVVSAITAQGTALMKMIGNIGSLADALHVAVESNASPEEVLRAAQTLLQAYDAAIQAAQSLKAQLDALNKSITDGVGLIVSLTAKIDTLRGASADPAFIQSSVNGMVYLFNTLTDVTSRIALFASGLALLAESTGGILANLPLVTAAFNTIMTQIQQMTNPQQAVTALKDLAGAIESGLQAGIAAINRQTQERITALNAEKAAIQQVDAARVTALNDEKTQLTKVYDTQKTALQASLALAQQWVGVLTSVKTQLTDLFNLLAPTHPLTSLNEVRAQFQSAFAKFQAGPTPELATQVQNLAKQMLDLAKQTPGYELPSSAFQGLAGEVQTALTAIQTFAASQPTQEQVQAQIAALDKQQADSLAAIDAQVTALNAAQSSQLAAIDRQIQQATLDGQAEIQRLQAVAASGLEAIRQQLVIEVTALAAQQAHAAAALQIVLGDKSFEQFIAEKQAEAGDLLRGIDRTLQDYLGSILTHLFPGVATPNPTANFTSSPINGDVGFLATNLPRLASGGIVTRPTLALIGEAGPEAIIPLRSGSTASTQGQSATVNISFTYAGSARKDEWDRFLDTVIDDARFGKLGKVISEKVKGR